jgi:hypothetical protein
VPDINPNPWGREYTPAELAAGKRLGVTYSDHGGPMIYAGGPYLPTKIRKLADDAKLVADALDREWVKPLPTALPDA